MTEIEIMPRSVWNARAPKTRHRIHLPTPELWLHHTAGALDRNGNGVWDDDLRAIQDFHMDTRGWSDIAYSFLIDHTGRVWEGRGEGIAGGHTKGRNTISHGIAVIGNHQTHHPSPAVIEAILDLVDLGHTEGWWPNQITGPHRDAPGANTLCCGRHLIALIPTINAQLRTGAPPMPESNRHTAEIQQVLTDAGFNPGPVDGIPGPRTANAVHAIKNEYTRLLSSQTISVEDAELGAAARAALDTYRNQSEVG